MNNPDLKRRILEISYKYKLSHIGSCLTAIDIIDEIYSIKKPDEKFVLSSGHAGLALYVVLEKYFNFINAEELFNKHGVHPNRDVVNMIDCSSGSLGHGLSIAVGIALADRSKNVYCLISDGEMAEGSIWEALRIAEENILRNLFIYINSNGWSAYGKTDYDKFLYGDNIDSILYRKINIEWKYTGSDMNDWPEWLQGQQAHYVVMDEQMYLEAFEVIK